MSSLLQDLRYSLRMMFHNRAFTILAVFTLAIGIGACTTVFSWVDAMLLRPLSGVASPDRLVAVETLTPNGAFVPNSYPDYRDFRDHLKLVSAIAVTHPAAFSVGQQDHAERVWGELVSGNFFAVLGTRATVGRAFLPEEYGDKPGAFPLLIPQLSARPFVSTSTNSRWLASQIPRFTARSRVRRLTCGYHT
jgi:hypothetical protein